MSRVGVVSIAMAIAAMRVPMILRVSIVPWHWRAVAAVNHWRRSYNHRSVMVTVPQRDAEADTGTRLGRGRKHRHYDCTQEE